MRIGSDNFENMGMFMFMTPATLSLAGYHLRPEGPIKDRLSNSGDSLYSGIRQHARHHAVHAQGHGYDVEAVFLA